MPCAAMTSYLPRLQPLLGRPASGFTLRILVKTHSKTAVHPTMANPQSVVILEAASSTIREQKTSSSFWFAAGLAAVLTLSLVAVLWASAQPWFFYHIASPVHESYGYSHFAYGYNCDVLIAGDSTSITDFASNLIEQRTKLKTCNVGEVRTNLDFAGTHYAIDDYLAHNRPPRFIVTGWTPAVLDLEHPPFLTTYADAFAYGMQFHRGPFMWKAMFSRPGPALTFVIWAGNSLVKDTVLRLTGRYSDQMRVDERARRDAGRGTHYLNVPAQTACVTETNHLPPTSNAKNLASAAEFRRHYTTAQTQVLIYVTPVADCDTHAEEYKVSARNFGERPLQFMPVSNFSQTNIHLLPESAKLYSTQVADDILAHMKSAKAAPVTGKEPQ